MSEESPNFDQVPKGLAGEPAYGAVPLRYEMTKPFAIQADGHLSILKIGQSIHEKMMGEFAAEKAAAVQEATEQVEQEAETRLRAEVERLNSHAAADRQRALQQQAELHQQQLREEKMRIESQINQFWEVKMEEALEEAEEHLKREIERTKQECLKITERRVAEARVEERRKAKEEQEAIQRANEERLEKERKKALKDKESSMARMKELLGKEKDSAVAAARIQEQNFAASELAAIITTQAERMVEMEEIIKEREQTIREREADIEGLKNDKSHVMSELNEQKLKLEHFVDTVRHFTPGENQHLIDKRGVPNYIPGVTPEIEGTDM